jgi:hypothetical protein
MKKLNTALLLAIILLAATPLAALAQNYSFSVPQLDIVVYVNADGTVDIDYEWVFENDPGADPIDFVDVGLPNRTYRLSEILAEVDGVQLSDIEDSPYVQGIAVGLGSNAIQPGQSGRLRVFVPGVEDMFFVDSTDPNYASVQFQNSWFGSEFVSGDTNLTLTIVLPPGMTPEEPRWHPAPGGFPDEPESGMTEDGRVYYTWNNPEASPSEGYLFGASVLRSVIDDSVVQEEPSSPPSSGGAGLGVDFGDFFPGICCFAFILFPLITGGLSAAARQQRKFQYLPPKATIGGHGIKRGLTAVESAILLEQPMDKILTMILFSAIKKGAASVTSRDPLEVKVAEPTPEGLRSYEEEFLLAFLEKGKKERSKAMQTMTINLVESVSKKMKGFSHKETVEYYKDIVDRAWAQVAEAETPEVKSQRYEEVMEWTMMDRDYEDRTRDVFRTGPVILPTWWGRYDPGVGRAPAPSPGLPGSGGRSSSPAMPTLPGSEFAASMVRGVETFAAGAVGSITDFTSGVTRTTNPPPPPSARSFSSSGGSSCACACAGCACACACAGGGR